MILFKQFIKTQFLTVIFLITCSSLLAQQNKSKVELLNAQSIKFDKNFMNGARRLIGKVKFKQDSTIMECDSAWFYSDRNMFDAFSNVHLYKLGNNNISIKSNWLRHNGDTKLAHFRHNVVLRDTQVILTTDSLDYNISKDIGYYLYGATIVDSASTLFSQIGQYYHNLNKVFFKKNVVVTHNLDEYQMYTDTLIYNTQNKIIYFNGPTEIYNDTNYMFAKYGWYNTNIDHTFMKIDAFYSNPKQTVTADSIFFDRNTDSGKGYSNVVMTDTSQNIIAKGNYIEVYNNPQKMIITDSALVIHIIDGDSLYMHADTILTKYDTSGVYREFFAYKKVKIFKSNFQVKTDSLFFSETDSIIEFHGSPVMWTDKNQITAQYIEGFIINSLLDNFKLYETGLVISMEDTLHYNQIKGKQIIGYIKNNKLWRIDVFKKSETIYFPTDEQGIIGINKSNSNNVSITFKDGKMHRLIYRETPTSTMYPLNELQLKETRVKEFIWLDNLRPKKPTDIFIWE